MKFSADTSEKNNATFFFSHTVSVALFSYAIARTSELQEKLSFSNDDFSELLKAAFFHNIGALCSIDEILVNAQSEQPKSYHEANRNSGHMLQDVKLGFDVMNAIRYINEYSFERFDFINREDSKSCWFANIIVAADIYSRLEAGLFGIYKKPSEIVDELNLLARDNKLNKDIVKAFSLGLNLKNIFDFYQEMDALENMCTFKGGRHAWPYPLTGFKSPTIFICHGNHSDCEYYEKSLKAVTLVKPMGKLTEGKYARCLLTSPKLQEFYMAHYDEIKSDVKETLKQKDS